MSERVTSEHVCSAALSRDRAERADARCHEGRAAAEVCREAVPFAVHGG